jgi:hypothetical protein
VRCGAACRWGELGEAPEVPAALGVPDVLAVLVARDVLGVPGALVAADVLEAPNVPVALGLREVVGLDNGPKGRGTEKVGLLEVLETDGVLHTLQAVESLEVLEPGGSLAGGQLVMLERGVMAEAGDQNVVPQTNEPIQALETPVVDEPPGVRELHAMRTALGLLGGARLIRRWGSRSAAAVAID